MIGHVPNNLERIGCDFARDPDQTVVTFWPGGQGFTPDELTAIAARAKAKVKATARGWSMLSQVEILALAWIADQFLEDGALDAPTRAKPQPPVISKL